MERENNRMQNDAIPENERLQMEQIMELEDEELEVEEVDEEDLSDEEDYRDSEGALGSGIPYDTSLVALHSYLGDVEDTNNRLSFLDGGAVLTLPLFYLEGVVLFPEATFPLRVIFPNFIAGVERAMRQVDAPYTIGVVRVYKDSHNGRIRFSTTGTTAEIRQYRRLEDGSVNIVARGQQRFRLKRRWIDVEGSLCGEVHIIQEDMPLRTPREAVGRLAPLRNTQASTILQMTPLNDSQRTHQSCEEGNDSDAMSEGSFESELSSAERRLHQYALVSSNSSDAHDESISSDEEKFERHLESRPERSPLDNYRRLMRSEFSKKNADDSPRGGNMPFSCAQPCNKVGWGKHSVSQLRDVSRAFWPSWVYRMYDSYSLARKVADRWKEVVKAPSMESLVMKPDLLSFHIASKIPISESRRQELLEIDGTTYRLRREIELLESFDKIHCKTCQILVAKRSDMLVMSSTGPLGAYANPHGFVHEVMTLRRTDGIAVTGRPTKEFSWFPGYAWSIAECMTCGVQVGWYFSATSKKMRPQAFWGIRSSQVVDEDSLKL